ncbi:uncharacterized protein MELLADRAFT_93993 [Melampsora larici-populina 98AG31]|uniref:Uncharacterized protein n=1 Tax=Melampsora larici-populina (strain 98AG31 / pathotype 3-4-7) TaxID=747676 RepID=F4S608_MELLP|nr:uncharacterized protein MELLADRAFT_93993 [Melampsora larici-populina 98AG31]EGF99924.1 hypothetical protein MELLADRAFT_93993 [Melampsora larici-populina 98AG31]
MPQDQCGQYLISPPSIDFSTAFDRFIMSQQHRRFFPVPPKKLQSQKKTQETSSQRNEATTSQSQGTNRRTRQAKTPGPSMAPAKPATKRRASERNKAASEQPPAKVLKTKTTNTKPLISKKSSQGQGSKVTKRPPSRSQVFSKPEEENQDKHRRDGTPTSSPPPRAPRAPINADELAPFAFTSASQIAQAHKYGEDEYVQRRNTRNTAPSHQDFVPLQGSRLQTYNRNACRFDLDNHYMGMGRELCNVTAPDDQFITSITVALANRQHMTSIHNDITQQIADLRESVSNGKGGSSNAAPATPWLSKEDSLELRKSLRQTAWKTILRGNLQAYTATKNRHGNKATLPLSLYAAVMDAVMSNSTSWKKRLLPRGYGKNPKTAHVKALKTLLNVVLKEVRKEFEKNLLENIQLPGRRATVGNGSVPSLNTIIANLHDKATGQIGGRVPVCNDEQRMQACHWGFYKKEYKDGATLWSVVDEKLELLRAQSSRYGHAFAIQCLTEDNEIFKGKKTLAEIRPLTSFPLPNETDICEIMDHLDETWGDNVPEQQALHEMTFRAEDKVDDEVDDDNNDDDEQLDDDDEQLDDDDEQLDDKDEQSDEEIDEDAGFDDEE